MNSDNDRRQARHPVTQPLQKDQDDTEATRVRTEAVAESSQKAVPDRPDPSIAIGGLSAQQMPENLAYSAALQLTREDALTLGVPGSSAAANTQRGLLAHGILDQWTVRSNEAYRTAVGPNEPDVPQPFGVRKLAAAAGDVRSVVEDPDFEDDVLRDMGHGCHTEFVSDEDGERYIFVEPTSDDLRQAAREATRIREVLAVRGVVSFASVKLPTVLQDQGPHASSTRAVREARHRHHTNLGRTGPNCSPF